MGEYKFYVLGCRGSRPVSGIHCQQFGGATSCYIIKADRHAIVLDCGTGLYDAGPFLEGCTHIDILLTHLHYDHILGLLNWEIFPWDARVRVYAGMAHYSRDYNPADFLKVPFWPISPDIGETICVGSNSTVYLNERVSARFAPANHPDGATIVRVDTDNGSMCLVCDWEHGAPVPEEMVRDCSFILYDGMFTETEYPSRKGWGHSTWQEGVKLAEEMQIPRLVITHHLPERTDEELLAMENYARQAFPNIHFARAGDAYSMSREDETV